MRVRVHAYDDADDNIAFFPFIICILMNLPLTTGTFWFIIRGVENYPVQLGDLTLPAAARLRLHRFQNTTVNNQLVTLADVADGTAGALFMTRFDASNPTSYGKYITSK